MDETRRGAGQHRQARPSVLAHVAVPGITELRAHNRRLHLSVGDDGVGGAIADGSGLVGLTDRVEALGGTILIDSPPGQSTKLEVDLPINLVERTSGYAYGKKRFR